MRIESAPKETEQKQRWLPENKRPKKPRASARSTSPEAKWKKGVTGRE